MGQGWEVQGRSGPGVSFGGQLAPKRRTATSSLLLPGALGHWVCIKVAVGWAEPCPFSGTVSWLVPLKTPDEGAHFWSDVICLWCFQEGFS